jgi:putative Ca2+/H+ antiporter (TMEM165/GDT1 family)
MGQYGVSLIGHGIDSTGSTIGSSIVSVLNVYWGVFSTKIKLNIIYFHCACATLFF